MKYHANFTHPHPAQLPPTVLSAVGGGASGLNVVCSAAVDRLARCIALSTESFRGLDSFVLLVSPSSLPECAV